MSADTGESGPLARTPLYARHVEAGARMVPFAGYEMPVLYSSILEEHRAVRSSAGLFDVSHMGEVRLRGPGAEALAERLFTNDVKGLRHGAVRYGVLCDDSGGTVDDVTLYRVGTDEFLFCVNASNRDSDLAWIQEVRDRESFDCDVVDQGDATGLLAIQGPAALGIVSKLLEPGAETPRRWRFVAADLAGAPVWLSRTGYTGEDGYEVYTPSEAVVEVWDALVRAGGEELTLAGLGARDTLRTEMAYPLYGHELSADIDPISAGLERFVAFGSGFVGESVLVEVKRRGPERVRVGLASEGRQVPRQGCRVLTADGTAPVGEVTSGTFGPSVERSIAIGYVPPDDAAVGTRLSIEIRGRALPARVVDTPFLDRKG